MLIGVRSAALLSAIMEYIHSNVAREIGREIDWEGRFWARRGKPTVCLSDADIADRLSYVLSNSVKENTVLCPYPGRAAGHHRGSRLPRRASRAPLPRCEFRVAWRLSTTDRRWHTPCFSTGAKDGTLCVGV